MINDLTIATVNFNTPEYIHALAHSIAKYTPSYHNALYVVDNGTTNRLPNGRLTMNGICMLDVHHVDTSIYTDIDKLPPSKYPAAGSYNSARHAKTIDWMMNRITTKYMLLVDSDVVIIQNIESIINDFINSHATLMGYKRTTYKHPCIAPWACLIDLQSIHAYNIKFYDATRMLYVHDLVDYDTGASFYEDVINNGLHCIETADNTYYRHFKGGSVYKEQGLAWLSKNLKVWF